MIKNEPFMKSLKCKLTDAEKALLSQRVVELVSKKEEVERQKAAASSRYGGELKEIWSEIAELSQRHREGFEYREVECYTEFSWTDGVAKVIRSDTYEMVSSRTISDDERQMHIDELEQEDNAQDTESNDIPDNDEQQEERDDFALQRLLAKVMEKVPTLKTIGGYTDKEWRDANRWATMSEAAERMDGQSFVPPKPPFLGK